MSNSEATPNPQGLPEQPENQTEQVDQTTQSPETVNYNWILVLPYGSPEVRSIINFDERQINIPGSNETLIEFASNYMGKIIRRRLSDTVNEEEIKQLIQDATLSLSQHPLNRFVKDNPDANAKLFKAFITSIARNLTIDEYQKRSHRSQVGSLEALVAEGEEATSEEASRALEAVEGPSVNDILNLVGNEKHREMLRLRFIENLKDEEIASHLGITSVSTVRTGIRRGLIALRKAQEQIRHMLGEDLE